MILFEMEMPNGAKGKFHRVINMKLLNGGIVAGINSFHREEMQLVTWYDEYFLPPPFSAENEEQVEMLLTQPGAPFGGGVFVPEQVRSLEEVKARKWGEVKSYKTYTEQNGICDTPYGPIKTDDASKIKLNGFITSALADPDFSITFMFADNTQQKLDNVKLIEIGKCLTEHLDHIHKVSQEYRERIEAAPTIDDVYLIQISTDWSSPLSSDLSSNNEE